VTWQNTEKGENYIMGKIIDLSAVLEKEEKLQQVADYMEELKNQFSELIQEYEDDGVDARKVDTLTEALDALEDAYDMVCEVVEDGK
jgi:archaellum component FlaC